MPKPGKGRMYGASDKAGIGFTRPDKLFCTRAEDVVGGKPRRCHDDDESKDPDDAKPPGWPDDE